MFVLFPLKALICLVDKKSGEKSKMRPRFVKQDQVCIARLRTAGTICLETFKDFPQMGRFTLRDEGKAPAHSGTVKRGISLFSCRFCHFSILAVVLRRTV